MLTIYVPDNNLTEREYILNIFFREFLGLDYLLLTDSSITDYSIQFGTNELIIKDCFFNLYPVALSYLSSQALPSGINYGKNDLLPEDDIPIIYGTDEITTTDKKLICGLDIFGSSFFMLTRWEEYVNNKRDEHLRFPGEESVAFRYGFLNRPVVNEYMELLWNLMLKLGFNGKRKERSFDLVLTHDIDHLNYPLFYRILLGDILKRRNIKRLNNNLGKFLKTWSNPYDTFDFILKISEKLSLKSHFYFIASDSGRSPDTQFYIGTKRFRDKTKEIINRGHIIGFHPGYYTFNDPMRWSYEKNLLSDSLDVEIVEGRQHYLRFQVPFTYRIWDGNDMRLDSTMGYANEVGFRCGTGDTFGVFDFLDRRVLNLRERPLILMDGALKRQYPMDQATDIMKYYISISRKYSSSVTFLFHNSTFYGEGWEGYDKIYAKLPEL